MKQTYNNNNNNDGSSKIPVICNIAMHCHALDKEQRYIITGFCLHLYGPELAPPPAVMALETQKA